MRLIGLAGFSGAGKTTLIARLIPELRERGLSVSTIKHAHKHFDVDYPGKDSHTHRVAGAMEVLVSSPERFALMHELRGAPEPSLAELVALLSPVDIVLVEGWKPLPIPKIEVHRHENGKPFLYPDDRTISAVATDRTDEVTDRLAIALSATNRIADHVESHALERDEILHRLAIA